MGKRTKESFMNSQQLQFLNLRKLPARLNAEDVACLLGFGTHDIPLLVAAGLLKPLGRPPVNGVKHFAAVIVEGCRNDVKWLAQASDCTVKYWRGKNMNRKTGRSTVTSNESQI